MPNFCLSDAALSLSPRPPLALARALARALLLFFSLAHFFSRLLALSRSRALFFSPSPSPPLPLSLSGRLDYVPLLPPAEMEVLSLD